MQGWDYARENPEEAAYIVLENDATGAQTEKHQKRMMVEIAKLLGGDDKGLGYLDPAAYQRTVDTLLANPSTRSEEHTSELQSLMRIPYAVFCLKKKNDNHTLQRNTNIIHYIHNQK